MNYNIQRENVSSVDLQTKIFQKSTSQFSPQKRGDIKTSRFSSQVSGSDTNTTTRQNCVIEICYNGEPRQFAISGQLLQSDEIFQELPEME